jgi:hypothetical protein
MLPPFINQVPTMADAWSKCGFYIDPWNFVSPSDFDGVWGIKTMLVYKEERFPPIFKTYYNIRPSTMKTKLHMFRPSKCIINKNA